MLIIDTRNAESFMQAHIPGSVFVGYSGGDFEYWIQRVIPDFCSKFYLVTEPLKLKEITDKLQHMGYQFFSVISDVKRLTQSTKSISSADLLAKIKSCRILDVRENKEVQKLRLKYSDNLPLSEILKGRLPAEYANYYTHCAGGYRSLIAVSWINRSKSYDLINIEGGMDSIRQAFEIDKYFYLSPIVLPHMGIKFIRDVG